MTLQRLVLLGALACASGGVAAQPAAPLRNAHAHNDYLHERPLLDALDHGFCSVEADIWLVDGQLLVAHDLDKVSPERTLEGLYLEPLRERVRRNGGRVYTDGHGQARTDTPEFILLIDIKGNGRETYPVLRELLKKYEDILTTFSAEGVTRRAVRAIISGGRPRDLMEAEEVHYAAYDGRLEDLEGGASPEFIPLISASWAPAFSWRGNGPIPEEERSKLREIVSGAHEQGRKVRFWAIPHDEAFWAELLAAGVDLINVDQLERLRVFLELRR
jgi:hypothetical protein